MAFLAQNLNSTNDFGLQRHIEYIPRGTGNQKCRPSTIANHCALVPYIIDQYYLKNLDAVKSFIFCSGHTCSASQQIV